MIRLLDLQEVHAGRPAAILGGGPSLPDDVKRLPAECVLYAANDHAFHVNIVPDYMVFMDDPHCKPELLQLASQKLNGTLRITDLLQYTDVDMRGADAWVDLSGMTAAWIACFMGCDPVVLCGMDLYQGDIKYCHDKDSHMDKPIFKRTLDQHLAHWRKVFDNIPRHARIRAMSGPLTDVFGSYN